MSAVCLMLLDMFAQDYTSTQLVSYALDLAEAAVKSFMIKNLSVRENLVTAFFTVWVFLKVYTSKIGIMQSLKVFLGWKLQSKVFTS